MERIVYDYINESSIDEELKCSICKEPFQDPVNTPCDHTFCENCIEQWINEDNNSCPTCRRSLSINSLIPATRIVVHLLDRLQVQCQTCGEKSIQRSSYIDHISKTCPHTIVSCLAEDILCPWKGPRFLLNKHYEQCPYQQVRSILTDLIQTKYQLNQKIICSRIEHQQYKSQINKLRENEENLQGQIEQLIEKIIERDDQISQLKSNERIYKEQNQFLTKQLREARLIVESIIQTVAFDSLDTSSKLSCDEIPENFAGYKWINGWYITKHHATVHHPNTSWLTAFNHRDNHTCVAFNKDGKTFILQKSQPGLKFSINSFEIIPIHHTIMELIIIARRAKQQIYSRTIKLSALVTYVVDLNWENIDELEIKSRGIVPIPRYQHSVPHFALISLQLTEKDLFKMQNIINLN